MKTIIPVKLIIVMLAVMFMLPVLSRYSFAQNDLSVYQKEYLELQIRQAVNSLFVVWEEERYAEQLYDFGNSYSRRTISQQDFADRMNRNRWTVISSDSKVTNIDLKELTMAFVNVEIMMAKKNNRSERYKIDTTFSLVYENTDKQRAWRFNLLRIVAFPYPF